MKNEKHNFDFYSHFSNSLIFRLFFAVNEVIRREREENVESFVNTERSGLEGNRRGSIFRRNILDFTSLDYYSRNNGKYDEYDKQGFLSILLLWDLTIQIFVSKPNSVLSGMTTSPGKLTSTFKRNSSPSCDSIVNQNEMPPNNTTLEASQALNQVRSNQSSQDEKEDNSSSVKSNEYSRVRTFLENDVLHEYLARRAPNLIRLEERSYTLYDVSCLSYIISSKIIDFILL